MNTPSSDESLDSGRFSPNVTCCGFLFSPAGDSVDQLRNFFRKGASYQQILVTFPRAVNHLMEDRVYADFLRKDIQRLELFLRMEGRNLRKDQKDAAESVLAFRREELQYAEPSRDEDTMRVIPVARPSRLRDTIRYFFGDG